MLNAMKNTDETNDKKRDSESLFKNAFTGMYDQKGKPIHEGDNVRFYYKGEYIVCQVVYDPRNAAFLIKWPDGYINQYFMNGSSYEVI